VSDARTEWIDAAPFGDARTVATCGAGGGRLLAAERAIFARIGDEVRGGRVLDLGVGTGRTLPFLRGLASRYVALGGPRDVVEECRRRHPGADVRVGDARDLGIFEESGFDLVVFASSGLDRLPHVARLRALAAIRRVLAPGALFVFSTHNRSLPRHGRRPAAREVGPRTPWGAVAGLVRGARLLWRRRRRRRYESHGPGYSILNDAAEDFARLTYFVSRAGQEEQLREAGFDGPALAVDEHGREVAGEDRESARVHYVARADWVERGARPTGSRERVR
jgi:SAM-dependent methyltransferase